MFAFKHSMTLSAVLASLFIAALFNENVTLFPAQPQLTTAQLTLTIPVHGIC